MGQTPVVFTVSPFLLTVTSRPMCLPQVQTSFPTLMVASPLRPKRFSCSR